MNKYFLTALFAIALLACNRDEDPIISEEDEKAVEVFKDISEDQSVAQSLWDDLGAQVDGSSGNAELGDSVWSGCATITIDTLGTPFPLNITVDYGTEGCTGPGGRVRKGKLIYTLTGPYREAGSKTTTTPDAFYIDDHLIQGLRVAENLGVNNAGQIEFSIRITNGAITDPNGEVLKWESSRTRTWIEGQETGFFTIVGGSFLGWDGITDDVYEVEGTGLGVTRDGYTFDMEITSPLRIALDCRYITAGVLSITPDNYEPRTLDYGDGNCDNEAALDTPLGLRLITLGN